MAIFKCKMCGGTIEFEEGATVGVCDSCGTKQTLPKTNDEIVANLFNRANNLRLKCEFDRAAEIYESIVREDDSEAEAHWGIVLCKYGIEYVDDPKTKTKIPTCHRTLFDAVTKDPDYQAAIDYSDTLQQMLYEKEAKEIDRIQRDILAIVRNEKPFDVFICYKETDENGKRTVDSTIANDIYYQLTDEGFKVFYAAITLEDKLGQEYEPYIFAALNSAKVMLVIGTKSEYLNAVWVKNEWSRFMQLMKTDRSKLLIPCYRDITAYDLPEEFSHLQGQDMAKIGFINDVVRGIKKVIVKDEPKAVKETIVVNNAPAQTSVAPLLERAFMFLEDGDFAKADEFCEQVLNQDPKNAKAYIGKLMAEKKVRKQENLKNCQEPFDNNGNYQKAVRYADPKIADELKGYVSFIKDRNETARLNGIYDKAAGALNNAKTADECRKAAELFKTIRGYRDAEVRIAECEQKAKLCIYDSASEAFKNAKTPEGCRGAAGQFKSISGFRDADELAAKCLEKADVIYKDGIYNLGVTCMAGKTVASYEKAIEHFEKISGWKDANEQLVRCRKLLEECKVQNEQIRLENQRREEERIRAQKKAEKAKKTKKIVGVMIFIAVIVLAILGMRSCRNSESYVFKTEENSDGTLTLVKYRGKKSVKDVEIPSEIKGKKVTGIGDYAFYAEDSIVSVTIPKGVTSIGHGAFSRSKNLTSVKIPDGVYTIGESAFELCQKLSSVELPDSVTSIGDEAFYSCSGLTSITIPDSVTSIGQRAFSYCSGLTSITIPDSVTSIGESAFSGCTALESVTLSKGITRIGEYAFMGCGTLTEVTIPDGVKSIGKSAFNGCEKLTSVTIPAGVTSIGAEAFGKCNNLKSITFGGTRAQWVRASEDSMWYTNDAPYTVHCTDGDVDLGDYI